MKIELIPVELLTHFNLSDNTNNQTFMFKDYSSYLTSGIKLDITESDFLTHIIVGLIFFDGSVPKRFVKEINYDATVITIITNRADITFSTMDYRGHYFFFKIDKELIKDLDAINYI